jgi:hypothetical protein
MGGVVKLRGLDDQGDNAPEGRLGTCISAASLQLPRKVELMAAPENVPRPVRPKGASDSTFDFNTQTIAPEGRLGTFR